MAKLTVLIQLIVIRIQSLFAWFYSINAPFYIFPRLIFLYLEYHKLLQNPSCENSRIDTDQTRFPQRFQSNLWLFAHKVHTLQSLILLKN